MSEDPQRGILCCGDWLVRARGIFRLQFRFSLCVPYAYVMPRNRGSHDTATARLMRNLHIISLWLPCFQGFNVALQSEAILFGANFGLSGSKIYQNSRKIRYMNAKGIIIVQSESDLYTPLEFCRSRHNLDSEDAANKDKRLEKTRNMYRPVDSHGR